MHKDTKHFWSRELAEVAARLEAEFQSAFRPYGVRLVLQPHQFSHLWEIGEGFELQLHPDHPKSWNYWGDFESCVEVLRRRRWSRGLVLVTSLENVEVWARTELGHYLTKLRSDGGDHR